MLRCIILTFLFFASSLLALSPDRIYSHLLIRDYESALQECEKALQLDPDSEVFKEAYIRALAEAGKDEEAILLSKKWKKDALSHDMLEALAWSILHRSADSRQISLNMVSLMGAFYTHDVRASHMLKTQMHSSNAFLRAMAVQLSPQYRDEVLIREVLRLFEEEKVWYVRLEVIKALGAIGTKEVKNPLKRIVADSRSSVEERGMAASALVNLYEEIESSELSELAKSNRGGLRLLACQVINHLDLKEEIGVVLNLLHDSMPDVRLAAINTLYLLGLKELSCESLLEIEKMMDDPHPTLSITAAWIALRFSPQKGVATLKKHVYSSDDKSRLLAAQALGSSLPFGVRVAAEVIKLSPDPFVRANLALGLIRSNVDIELAVSTLYQFLMTHQEKIMWENHANPLFQVLAPSRLHHIPDVSQYPVLIDKLTRLDILNYLAILKAPQAEEAMKSFLSNKVFGVSYAASMALLEEGGEEALNILSRLLKDEDEKIRLQAALVLALSGKDPEAVAVLQKAYFSMDREMKINILGAIGHIGDQKSISFLLDRLEESHQILKVVAASALIQCLYH